MVNSTLSLRQTLSLFLFWLSQTPPDYTSLPGHAWHKVYWYRSPEASRLAVGWGKESMRCNVWLKFSFAFTSGEYDHGKMCNKPAETCSMPIPLNWRCKCCTEDLPQDALPCSKRYLQTPIDLFPEELLTYTDSSTKGKVGCKIPRE